MCTRVVYSGKNGMVATGRSMDWKTEMHSNLWVFPKGMERNGETGTNSLKWTSKYGSVVTSAFEIASTDGMNEKGLVPIYYGCPKQNIRSGIKANRDLPLLHGCNICWITSPL